MSEQTPSQAEGEREPGTTDVPPSSEAAEAPRTTPSQAEGERTDEEAGSEEANED
ncbi:hypothetical protein [Streptomyces sp. NPDC057854]|uniref:hypothetical protein n=1 Tax=unclassified Streptomyces TaxID=2593676 RepID=UPI0036935EFD